MYKNVLLCLTNCPNHKDILFTIIQDKHRQQILRTEELEVFHLKNKSLMWSSEQL